MNINSHTDKSASERVSGLQSRDKLFLNGNIITMNETLPIVEAMAIKGEVVDAVGDTLTLKAAYPDADL
jgi:predicted amidohydrolase YtcJ